MIIKNLDTKIQKAAHVIGTTWPLYSFVTSNPLSGFENHHFENAIKEFKKNRNARFFP